LKFVFSGELGFFLAAYRQKGVLNKKGRRTGCDEVGSDQPFFGGKREPESFSPETRMTYIRTFRSWKKSPADLEMARFKIGLPQGGLFFLFRQPPAPSLPFLPLRPILDNLSFKSHKYSSLWLA